MFVANLSWDVDDYMLNAHMSQAGAIVHAEVLVDGNRSKGGFIHLATLILQSAVPCDKHAHYAM